jgi:aspartokinase
VHNQPGVGAVVIEALRKSGVDIESFQAVSDPASESGDLVMLAVRADKVDLATKGIIKANGKVGGAPPVVIEDLVGITIRGITIANSTEILHRAFEVFAKLGINVPMAYTARLTLQVFINANDFNDRIVEELKKELEE